jgi:hypothetical protein
LRVRRTHGWATLARIAIEVIGLAFADRMMHQTHAAKRTWSVEFPSVPSEAQATTDAAMIDEKEPEAAVAAANEIETHRTTSGIPTYLSEIGDDRARYYRSADDATAWIAAAFYDDGRVRIVDGEGNHYAGRVENGRAALTSTGSDERCELFIDMAADGNVRLSLLGGPHDGRVVRCEAVTA